MLSFVLFPFNMHQQGIPSFDTCHSKEGNCLTHGCGKTKNQWCHFGVGAPPILVYFNANWDVQWGYDLDFDPWPQHCKELCRCLPRPGQGIFPHCDGPVYYPKDTLAWRGVARFFWDIVLPGWLCIVPGFISRMQA